MNSEGSNENCSRQTQPVPTAGDQWIGAGIAGILFIGVFFGFKACSSPPSTSQSTSAFERAAASAPPGTANTMGAWTYMKEFVRQQLKSPATADFPFGGHRSVTALGNDRYLVNSYVDSQNSFGAQVRTQFSGVITETPSGWKLESLELQQ